MHREGNQMPGLITGLAGKKGLDLTGFSQEKQNICDDGKQ